MKNWLLKGTLALACVVAIPMAGKGVEAEAATPTVTALAGSHITVDSDKKDVTIAAAATKDSEYLYRFGKVTVKTVTDRATKEKTSYNVAAFDKTWTTIDNVTSKAEVIDLSNMANTVDNLIQIKGNRTGTLFTIRIPAAETKVAASVDYSADNPAVTLNNITDKKNPIALTGVQYRNTTSNWAAYTSGTTSLSEYLEKGGVVYFRKAAGVNVTCKNSPVTTDKIVETASTDAEAMAIYNANAFAGKEVKVSIKKRAAGPALSADYAKHRFTVTSGTEYRVISADGIVTWTTADVTKAIHYTADLQTAYNTANTALAAAQTAVDNAQADVNEGNAALKGMKSTDEGYAALKQANDEAKKTLAAKKAELTAAKKAYTKAYNALYTKTYTFNATAANKLEIKAGTVEARYLATAAKPKSVIKALDINAQDDAPTLVVTTTQKALEAKNAEKTDVTTVSVKSKAGTGGDDYVVVEKVLNKNEVEQSGQLKFTNKTADSYQIVVADASKFAYTSLPDGTTVNSGKNDAVKVTVYTIGAAAFNRDGSLKAEKSLVVKNIGDGQEIYICKAANAKTKDWATAYVCMGKYVAPTTE